MQQAGKDAVQRARLGGSGHGVPDLAQDLRLPKDHGVYPGSYPEQVPNRLIVGEEVGYPRLHLGPFAGPEGAQQAFRLEDVAVGGGVQLGTVAGGEDNGAAQFVAQPTEGGRQLLGGEGKLLPLR